MLSAFQQSLKLYTALFQPLNVYKDLRLLGFCLWWAHQIANCWLVQRWTHRRKHGREIRRLLFWLRIVKFIKGLESVRESKFQDVGDANRHSLVKSEVSDQRRNLNLEVEVYWPLVRMDQVGPKVKQDWVRKWWMLRSIVLSVILVQTLLIFELLGWCNKPLQSLLVGINLRLNCGVQ